MLLGMHYLINDLCYLSHIMLPVDCTDAETLIPENLPIRGDLSDTPSLTSRKSSSSVSSVIFVKLMYVPFGSDIW